MNNWSTRLKSKMQELAITQEELANKLGVSRSAVGHYVQGTRTPPLRQLTRLAGILKCDPSWLQFGSSDEEIKTQQASANQIPILDWKDAKGSKHTHPKPIKNLKHLAFSFPNKDCYALQIKNDSMLSPTPGICFLPDSFIIIDPRKSPDNGDFVIAQITKNNEKILRQYVEEGGNKYLKPLNPQYPLILLDRTIKIIGTLIANIYIFSQ